MITKLDTELSKPSGQSLTELSFDDEIEKEGPELECLRPPQPRR
jgi:hypothetical protein